MSESHPLDEATAVSTGAAALAGESVERTSSEPIGWTRRADFACSSPKCKTSEGEAMVYELRVDATHCPMGHKRLMRLFNQVAVVGTRPLRPDVDMRITSSSRFERSKPLLQGEFDHADKFKLQDKSMRSHEATPREMAVLNNVLGAPGGKGRPMTPTEIRDTLKRDPVAPSSIMARQWDRGIPSNIRTRAKDGTPG